MPKSRLPNPDAPFSFSSSSRVFVYGCQPVSASLTLVFRKQKPRAAVLRAQTRNPLILCPSRLTRSRHPLCAPSSGLISGSQSRQHCPIPLPLRPSLLPFFSLSATYIQPTPTDGQSVTAAQHHRSASAMAHEAGMFVVPQKIGHVLCPKCGILMTTNAANMCMKCLASEVDITDGLQKHVSIIFCPECKRYLQPPKCWIKAERES
ncbi:hypothetical protein Ancab_006016 [Ancistrocladus abbreviatus]